MMYSQETIDAVIDALNEYSIAIPICEGYQFNKGNRPADSIAPLGLASRFVRNPRPEFADAGAHIAVTKHEKS